MRTASGVEYPGGASLLTPAHKFLAPYTLPDTLVLQCLVHKSFAHGQVPYNEKLAVLGQQALRLAAAHAAATRSLEPAPQYRINGHNFDVAAPALEVLTSTPVLAEVCTRAEITPSLFFKTPDTRATPTVRAKSVSALMGALLLQKGSSSVTQFVCDRLTNGELDIFSIADVVYKG